MRTNEERIQAMHERAHEIKAEKAGRKALILESAGFAVCFAAAILLAFLVPPMAETLSLGPEAPGMSASIFAGTPALGYIVIAAIAFILGVTATVFSIRLKRWRDSYGEKQP